MTSRKHLLISLCVTVLVAILFAFFTKDLNFFKLTNEYQLIPEGFAIPRGCDVRMDMQTGEIWARLAMVVNPNGSLISIEPEKTNENIHKVSTSNSKIADTGAPEYQNLTKNRIQSRYSHESAGKIELALQELHTEDAWIILEEEAPAMEVGLGILESNNFTILREMIRDGNDRALYVLSICLQNNPLAVERANEIGLLQNEILILLSSDKLNLNAYQKLLKIIASILNHTNSDSQIKVLFNIKKEIVKQNLVHQDELTERSLEIVQEILSKNE